MKSFVGNGKDFEFNSKINREPMRTNSANETFELRKLEFLTHLLERCLPEVYSRTRRKHFSRSKILITKRGFTENKTKTSRNILPFITTLAPYN